uniref:Dentin sialophosphoprotein-like n=1 Tax=Stegastes partitus TaxID=144197 RepID=A0A3B5BAA1_9TELE
MDDLDHSIHIAEYDWTIFYEDSEECCLLQPLLACPDDWSLSDSEESGNVQQSPDAAETNAAGGRSSGEQSCTSATRERVDDAAVTAEESEICIDRPGGNPTDTEVVKAAEDVTEETSDGVSNKLPNVESSGESEELTKDVQAESNIKPTEEPDPLSLHQTGLNELHTTQTGVSVCSVALKAEKERWFVTVNDSPARQRARATSVKKKRRQKKPCEGSGMCRSEETSLENGFEINEDRNEPEGGWDTQSNSGNQMIETNAESVLDSSLMFVMSCEEENLSEKLPKEEIPEPQMDRSKYKAGGPTSTSRNTLTQLESVESDELEDSADFLSTHSYDSESYLSAAESVEEPQHPLREHLMENQQLHRSLSPTSDSHLFSLTEGTDADRTQDDGTPSSNAAATDCESYESTSAESSLTFPSAGQRAAVVPDDISTCDDDTHSVVLCRPADTPEPQNHKTTRSASACSQGDQLGPLPVPDLTVTLCSEVESPETYAKATGHTRPVYAISGFWDEMEKLTINDILQLRMGRSSPPRETQDTVTPNGDDSPTNPGSLVDTAEYSSSDSTLMDTSDTADSDYFTHSDESKPDRSSCEFSTSDFEEEYWQFLGTSRNPSPDPHSKKQRRTSLDDPESSALNKLELPRRMTKSKSMHNVQALNALSDDESSLFLSRSLEDNTVLKVSKSLEALIPASLLTSTNLLDTDYRTSTPEAFEYFFTEDKTSVESRCVTVYDPEDISVAPVFDYTLCTCTDDISSSSLQCSEEKPIPIFSCSHPTVRELTFPKPDFVFLSSNCEGADDISPIRVVSHSFIQPGSSWKSLMSIRKIRFHDKGSIWCRRSGAWMFPVEAEKISDAGVTVLSEGRICPTSSHVHLALCLSLTEPVGIFSTLKQSDMCLVCIAFASWVLKSSDPEAADAWKAALLANVSALSAIQYLRQYVKKKSPPQDEP